MNEDNRNPNSGKLQVEDSEGFVDRQIKKDIISLRNNIDRALNDLNVYTVHNNDLAPEQARQYVYNPVKTYLMRIEPLMKNSDTPGAEELYLRKPLGTVEIYPPPVEIQKKAPGFGFRDSELVADLQKRHEGEKAVAVLSKESDVPRPQTLTVNGVKTIIDRTHATTSWDVKAVKKHGKDVGAPEWGDVVTITNTERWPLTLLTNTIRATEEFLDKAGVGLALTEENNDPLTV